MSRPEEAWERSDDDDYLVSGQSRTVLAIGNEGMLLKAHLMLNEKAMLDDLPLLPSEIDLVYRAGLTLSGRTEAECNAYAKLIRLAREKALEAARDNCMYCGGLLSCQEAKARAMRTGEQR